MSLTPITSAPEIRQARETMLATLGRGCKSFRRWIGWQGGSGEFDVVWNPVEQFWVRSSPSPYEGRWMFWFGNDDPVGRRMLGITCEVNPTSEGIDRRCAGLFVRDEYGEIYFTHSGKIGGGRKGIGKSAFLSQYRGARECVTWEDGKKSEVIVLGRIDGDRLAARVADFIREVQRFKAGATHGGGPAIRPESETPPTSEPQFSQEFSGKRRGYRVASEIEARCDHGLVINTLARALEKTGLKVANDKNRDLYVLADDGGMRILFEAKMEVTSSTVYHAIGQLLFHSATQSSPPALVMVLPATPNDPTRQVLNRLGIEVLVFEWNGQQPAFRKFNEVVRTLAA